MDSHQISPSRCRPIAGLTTIEFVAGGPSAWFTPKQVEPWQLPFRFAVVQGAYRPDMVDMFNDRSVWQRLFDFASAFAANGSLVIIDRPREANKHRAPTVEDERTPEAYFAAVNAIPDEDWNAPEFIMVRERGELTLVIAAEYWMYSGGPNYYHDSMTYSIFSKVDLGDRVMHFLRDAPAAAGWNMAPTPMPPPEPSPPILHKLFGWLKRDA